MQDAFGTIELIHLAAIAIMNCSNDAAMRKCLQLDTRASAFVYIKICISSLECHILADPNGFLLAILNGWHARKSTRITTINRWGRYVCLDVHSIRLFYDKLLSMHQYHGDFKFVQQFSEKNSQTLERIWIIDLPLGIKWYNEIFDLWMRSFRINIMMIWFWHRHGDMHSWTPYRIKSRRRQIIQKFSGW